MKLFYIVKVYRIVKGLQIFKIRTIIDKIKYNVRKRVNAKCKEDPTLAENQDIDSNCINILFNIGYALRTIKLILIIVNVIFFLGLAWLIFSELTRDFTDGENFYAVY